mgnify:CR=1 FL=1
MTPRYNYDSKLVELAYGYLLDHEGVTEEIIDKHMEHWKEGKAHTTSDLLFGMVNSVRNRRGMPNAIGDIERLREFLEDFSPLGIASKYKGDWEKLFITIERNYTPPGRMAIGESRSYWVIFCKSVISASDFLSKFSSVDDFDNFVSQFYLNEYTRVALPLFLDKEIFGFGFALACDFLKENGYPKFVKPDVHIKKIFNGLGISNSESDYDVFKDVIRFSESINQIPYEVDKLFWLVGSGNFYLNIGKVVTSREEFISIAKKELQ